MLITGGPLPFIIFFAALATAVAIAVLVPRLRALAIMAALALGAVMGAVVLHQANQPEIPVFAAEDLVLSAIEIDEGPRFTAFSGRVENRSWGLRLKGFDVTASLMDCPADTSAPADCAIIGEDTAHARVDVPPGQTRAFRVVMTFAGTPPVQGVARWDYGFSDIVAVEEPARIGVSRTSTEQ